MKAEQARALVTRLKTEYPDAGPIYWANYCVGGILSRETMTEGRFLWTALEDDYHNTRLITFPPVGMLSQSLRALNPALRSWEALDYALDLTTANDNENIDEAWDMAIRALTHNVPSSAELKEKEDYGAKALCGAGI